MTNLDNGFRPTKAHRFPKRPRPPKGIKHKRTRPYTPRTNGKAERFIRTMLARLGLRRHLPLISAERTRRPRPAGSDFYNRRRPHGALSHQPAAHSTTRGRTGTTSSGAAPSCSVS